MAAARLVFRRFQPVRRRQPARLSHPTPAATILHAFGQCKATGRMENFKRAARWLCGLAARRTARMRREHSIRFQRKCAARRSRNPSSAAVVADPAAAFSVFRDCRDWCFAHSRAPKSSQNATISGDSTAKMQRRKRKNRKPKAGSNLAGRAAAPPCAAAATHPPNSNQDKSLGIFTEGNEGNQVEKPSFTSFASVPRFFSSTAYGERNR